jgi:hypothetical protein
MNQRYLKNIVGIPKDPDTGKRGIATTQSNLDPIVTLPETVFLVDSATKHQNESD